jgi:hypothetical protein
VLIKRSILCVCFLLSGLALDAQWTWYSHHFNSACTESGNTVEPSWFLFSAAMLVPAAASFAFSTNRVYLLVCLVVWLSFLALQFGLVGDEHRIESRAGINCYRDVGAAGAISFLLELLFSALIVIVTFAFGAAYLVRRIYRKRAPPTDQPKASVNA